MNCPAAVPLVPSAAGGLPGGEVGRDAGSLAHEGVRRWIESDGWRETGPAGLRHCFDEAAEAAGVALSKVPRGLLTRARLGAMAGHITMALDGVALGDILCEAVLLDESAQLRGRADIIVTGANPRVLDLKTGDLANGVVPAQVRFQLLLYAHLFRATHGHLPDRLEVLSLGQGGIEVPFSPHDVDAALADIAKARDGAGGAPTPTQEGCRYCPRRLFCDAHWGLDREQRPDSQSGLVIQLATASNGVRAMQLDAGGVWVTHLRPSQVPIKLTIGDRIRVIGLRPPRSEDSTEWQGTSASAISIVT